MDKIEQLFELFESNNLTGGITIDRFKQATEDERAQLFELLKQNELDGGIDYNLFSSAWGEKKNQNGTPSTSQEDVTVSTTKDKTTPTSLESSDETTPSAYKSINDSGLETLNPELYSEKKSLKEALARGKKNMPKSKADLFLIEQEKEAKRFQEIVQEVKREDEELGKQKKIVEDLFDRQTIKPQVDQSALLKERLSNVNKELINRGEEFVVPQLQYLFEDLEFQFEKTEMTGDFMSVKAHNDKTIEISLDNFLDSKSESEANKLKKFIEENTPQRGLFVLENTIREQDKKFNSQKQVDDEIKKSNNDITSLNAKQKDFLLQKSQYESEIAELEKVPVSQRNTDDFKNKLNQLEEKRAFLLNDLKSIFQEEELIKQKNKSLEKAVGKYSIAKAKQGTWGGGLRNAFLRGVGKMSAGFSSVGIDILTEILPTESQMSPKDLKDVTIQKAAKLGVVPPTEDQSIEDWKKTLTPEQLDDWEDEIDDYVKKRVKKDILPATREGLVTLTGDPDTTLEWDNLKKEGFWGGAFLGLSESLPAMIGGAGPAGWAQRTAQMYAQISDSLAQEMENDPDFADISENEKLLITLPIGITSAALEAYGLRNILASKGIVNSITMSVLNKSGRNVSAKTFRELVEYEVESRLAKGLLIVGAAGLAEAETGALQEVSETSFKKIYNEIKGKDMFEMPESALDFVENVVVAGGQEAVGGFVLGVPSGVSAAYAKKGFLKMDDTTFEMFVNIANDENMQSSYIAKLKEGIALGNITTSQAKEQLNNYRNSVGLFRQLPDGMSTQQQKEAMNLLKEKRDLENFVKGKDPALVVKQKNRIAEINQSLTELSQQPSTEYIIDGKQYTREEFINQLDGKTQEELNAMNIVVNNDQATSNIVTEKIKKEGATEIDNRPISERQAEAESKIKRKDLFTGVGEFSKQLGNSDKAAVPISHNENNGIEIVEYAHPDTGSVDVIVTGKSENDFVGFYRIYENGKPTNKWSSKFENQSRNKEDFKTMISGAQNLLPEGHQYTEKTSISTDGLRVWEQQLNKGYEIQTDENGNIVTNRVAINGDAISNVLGVDVDKGSFENIRATKEEFENIKKVLTPYMEKLGLTSDNIHYVSGGPAPGSKGSVRIDLPVLKKSEVVEQEARDIPDAQPATIDEAQEALEYRQKVLDDPEALTWEKKMAQEFLEDPIRFLKEAIEIYKQLPERSELDNELLQMNQRLLKVFEERAENNPFKKGLINLGYTDADISNMTLEQQQDILINKTQKAEVASSAKVNSVKENERQERIAELQRQLDLEVEQETPQAESEVVTEEGKQEIPEVEAIETVDVSKGFTDYNPQDLKIGEEVYYSFDGKSYSKGKVVNRPSASKQNVYTIENENGVPTVIIYGGERTNVTLKKPQVATQGKADQDTEQADGEQGAEAYVAELKTTKESDPSTYWSVTEVSVEAAAEGTVINTENGGALVKKDGDIVGVFKKIGSKVKGVAQDLLKRAVEAGGTKLDNFVTGAKGVKLQEAYEKAGFRVVSRTPFNEKFAPEGWTPKDGKPDVVAMVYDPNKELDIDEKMFPDPENGYDQMIAYRDSVLEKSNKTVAKDQDGVSKLREMFKSPSQRKQVDNALNALSKIAPDVEVILHESEQAYAEATGETGRKQKTSGTYDETIVDGKVKKVIHINPDKANARTVAHEAFHAIFLNMVKTDAEAQRLAAAMIKAVYKSAPAELKKLIDNFAESKNADGSNNYDSAVQNEEKLAELIGYLATEYDSLPNPTKNVIKRWLDRLAKMFGMKPFTDSEVIDVLNTIAKKVSTGEAITEQDVSVLRGGKVVSNPIKLIERKSVGGFDVQYTEANKIQELKDKNLLVEVNDVSGFSGFKTAITSPDDMLAGTISIDGKQIFEGGGGIFFVTKYGDVWASGKKGTANTLAKMINDSFKSNEGKGLLVLTKGADQKLISSVSGVNSSLAILDVMLDKGLISPSDFRSAVSGAVKAAGGIISLSGSSKQLKSDINEYFSDPTTTTFEKRGTVVKDIIGRIAQSKSVNENSTKIIELLGGDTNKKLGKGKTKIAQSLGDLVAGIAAEQLTKGLSVGDVYGIIEVNSEVEVVEDSHPSYPFHIRLKDGSSPKLILPKNRQNGSEVLKTSTGKVYRVGNVSVLSGSFNSDIKTKKQVSGRPSIDEVRKAAKENNISNADTNAYLKELGYTQEEIATKIEKEEDIYVKKGNKVVDWLKKTKRHLLSAKGFLPKNVFIAKEKKDQLISTEISIAERAAKRLNKLLKNQSEEVLNEVNNLMNGKEFKLPREIALAAKEMREHIDSLSIKLVESGAVKSSESIENIKNNLGSYLNRSYRVFDDKNWASKVSEEVVQEAKQYLKNSWYSQESKLKMAEELSEKQGISLDEWINKKVDQETNDIIKQKEANSFIVAATEGSKNLKVLNQRKEIPAEIRALMGEYNDPAYNYVVSVAKIINIVENQKFLEKIKDIGDGVFLFKEGEIRRGDDTRYVKVAAESNESLAPLNGYYMPKEIVEQLKSQDLITLKDSWFKKIYTGWLKSVAAVKKSKTIYSVGTHGKNVFGNARFMAQNGYLNPSDYNNAFKVLKNQFKGATDTELNELLDSYKKLGVINQSVNLNEIRSMFSGSDSFDIRIQKRMLEQTENKTYKNAKQKLKNIDKFLEDMYQAEDDLFKIVAYENEKRDYSDILYDKKYEELTETEKQNVDDYVSNIVKNILPNYSRIGNLGKGLKFIPVTGTFISFQIEAYRTAYNTVGLAINEIKSDNAKMRTKGAKRLVALMAVEGLKQSLLYFLGASFLGDDDEEEKISANDVRPFLPEWAKNSDIIVTSLGDGKFSYVNVSASDPYGGISQILNAAARGEDMSESIAGALKEFGDPVLSQDIFLSAIDDIVRNKTQYGGDLIEAGDDVFDKTGKWAERLWTAFEPGTLTSIRKIAKSKSSEEVGYKTIGMFTGLQPHNVDVKKILNFKLKDLKEDISNIRKEEYRAEYKVIDTGEIGDLFDTYKNVDEKLEPVFKDANNTVKKAMRLGVSIYDIDNMLTQKRFSNDDASVILFYDSLSSKK